MLKICSKNVEHNKVLIRFYFTLLVAYYYLKQQIYLHKIFAITQTYGFVSNPFADKQMDQQLYILYHLIRFSVLAFSQSKKTKPGIEYRGKGEFFILKKVNLPVMSRTLNYGI